MPVSTPKQLMVDLSMGYDLPRVVRVEGPAGVDNFGAYVPVRCLHAYTKPFEVRPAQFFGATGIYHTPPSALRPMPQNDQRPAGAGR